MKENACCTTRTTCSGACTAGDATADAGTAADPTQASGSIDAESELSGTPRPLPLWGEGEALLFLEE